MTRLPSQTAPAAAQSDTTLRKISLLLAGTLALALAAHIQVPFWPVKLSMQTFVVLMIGPLYGPRLGAATVAAYIAQGTLGLPVFQSGAGLAYLAGPTGGYLLGFLLSAILTGYLARRGAFARPATAVPAILAGLTAIYLPGLAWLAVLFGPENSLAYGLPPFLPGEALKLALVLALLPRIQPSIARHR